MSATTEAYAGRVYRASQPCFRLFRIRSLGVRPRAARAIPVRRPLPAPAAGGRPPPAASGEAGDLPHLVHRVQGGDLVGLGQGRVVEDGIDEVVDGAATAHDGLADVDQFGGAGAEHVDAEQIPGIQRHQELQDPVGIADDLPAGQFPVARDADLEGHVVLGELLFGPPYEADLGNAVDADRMQVADRVQRLPAGVMRRDPALFGGGGRQGGETDYVADRVDVRHRGPEALVHHDPAALVGGQAGRVQVEIVAGPLPAGRVHDGVGGDLLPAQQRRDGALGPRLDRGHRLGEPEGDGEIAQVVLERLDHLDVTELEHPVALLHDRDLGAEGREHGRVLDPDHAGARDHHRARDRLQVDDPVGGDDGALVELDAGRPGGPGAGGDHDLVRAGPADAALAAVDLHGVRVQEAARTGHGRDPVTGELAAHHVHLAADHVGGPGGQVGDGDLVLDPVALAVHLALVQAGQVEDRLAQGLGRDRARVQAHTAHHVLALDDRHPPLELRRGNGCLLAARPRAEYQHVEVVHTIQCDDRKPPFEPLEAPDLVVHTAATPGAAGAGQRADEGRHVHFALVREGGAG